MSPSVIEEAKAALKVLAEYAEQFDRHVLDLSGKTHDSTPVATVKKWGGENQDVQIPVAHLYIGDLRRASRTLAALSGEGETAPEPIEDLWFTDSRLPIMAMSADENPCVLKVFFRRPVTRQDRDDMIAAQNAFLRAQSPTPVSGLTEEERAEGLGLAHQTPMQDVEIEYWLNQADNYAEVSIPCDDLRSLIARAISPTPSVSALTEERAGLAAIRARHDAALARMADNNWPMSEGRQDIAALLAIVDKMRADQ